LDLGIYGGEQGGTGNRVKETVDSHHAAESFCDVEAAAFQPSNRCLLCLLHIESVEKFSADAAKQRGVKLLGWSL